MGKKRTPEQQRRTQNRRYRIRRRNKAIAAAYLAGTGRKELAEKHRLSIARIDAILAAMGARLPREEAKRRASEAWLRRWQSDADMRRRVVEGMTRARTIWPDCPPELRQDYETLKHYGRIRAADARATLERRDL